MKKTPFKQLMLLALIVLINTAGLAQPVGDDGPDPPPFFEEDGPDPPPTAPISDAIYLFLIGGSYFAFKQLNKPQKNFNQS